VGDLPRGAPLRFSDAGASDNTARDSKELNIHQLPMRFPNCFFWEAVHVEYQLSY
jgi:hypothetical protein